LPAAHPHGGGRGVYIGQRTEHGSDEGAPVSHGIDADLEFVLALEAVESILDPPDRDELSSGAPYRPDSDLVAFDAEHDVRPTCERVNRFRPRAREESLAHHASRSSRRSYGPSASGGSLATSTSGCRLGSFGSSRGLEYPSRSIVRAR